MTNEVRQNVENEKQKIWANLFKMPHSTFQDTGLYQQIHQQFIADNPGDIFFERVLVALTKKPDTFRETVIGIKNHLADGRVIMPRELREVAIFGSYMGHNVLIWIDAREYSEAFRFQIDIITHPDATAALKKIICSDLEAERLPVIKWWYKGRHGEETRDFYLPVEKTELLPEFYPDLGNPVTYLDEYMDSNESILLIAGPPGTGKTTLLRHLISRYKLSAHVIYDERLMDADGPFQSFLFDGEMSPRAPSIDYEESETSASSVMIIEDADTILTSREKDGNKLMSRFLNISDGLIKLPNKKLVFTANVLDFGNVDHALIRPGRCFGVMKTRELNLTEAQAVARAADLPIPMEKKEYSLAEIFNKGKTAHVRKIGFGTRH